MVDKKVVLITGAASGIGYEISMDFAKEGAKIVLTDINEEAVKRAADELKGQGFDCIGIKCDVTSEAEIKAAIEQTVETFGSLDVLINNAGMQHVSPIEEFPTEKY